MAPELVTAPVEALKLDLGCGEVPKEGFKGVDLYAPKADYRTNLLVFPWPWAMGSVDELHCSHFVEHIPMAYVHGGHGPLDDKDLDYFCAFFDECHRVLKHGGMMTVQVPYLQSHRAFQDPTHRRFLCESSFNYLNKPWRDANKLGHYFGSMDFDIIGIDRVTPNEEGVKHPEVAQARGLHYWNTTWDIIAHLQCVKGR